MCPRKLVGLLAFFTAIGMLLVLLVVNRLAILFMIAMLLLLGYCCYVMD